MFEEAADTGHEDDTDTWHHLAGVANKIAGLYIGEGKGWLLPATAGGDGHVWLLTAKQANVPSCSVVGDNPIQCTPGV